MIHSRNLEVELLFYHSLFVHSLIYLLEGTLHKYQIFTSIKLECAYNSDHFEMFCELLYIMRDIILF